MAQSTTTLIPSSGAWAAVDEVGEVPLAPVADRQGLAGPIGGVVRPGQRGLDLVLDRVGELRARSASKNLMPLYSGGLCDAEITTPDRSAEVGGEERDRGGGFDAGDQGVAARVPDAFDQGVLEPFARGTRVPADHERRMTLAVAAEHDAPRHSPSRRRGPR